MTSSLLRETLLRQLDMAWALARYHLDGLTTDECLRRPARVGLHVHRGDDGVWRADWPDRESYDLGPSSIAWTTWHMLFWWRAALDAHFGADGNGVVDKDDVVWPGDAGAVVADLTALHDRWRAAVAALDDEALLASGRSRFPFADRPLADVVAWLNLELMKNAAEIGAARFVLAVS